MRQSIEEPFHETIDSIVRILKKARSILFVTGAGISAESGVPTYRGVGGLYNVEDTEDGVPIEEALSASTLASNPSLTWKYLAQIAKAVSGVKHNEAHSVIAEMESHFVKVWTLTQNVDGFHKQAGAKNVVEAHGNMNSLYCTKCSWECAVDSMKEELSLPPLCPKCKAIVRPDVVLFGELITGRGIEELFAEIESGFDVTFSIGTSSVFPYIQAPIEIAKSQGNPTIEINPAETTISRTVDYYLPLTAGLALTEIWQRYQLSE